MQIHIRTSPANYTLIGITDIAGLGELIQGKVVKPIKLPFEGRTDEDGYEVIQDFQISHHLTTYTLVVTSGCIITLD